MPPGFDDYVIGISFLTNVNIESYLPYLCIKENLGRSYNLPSIKYILQVQAFSILQYHNSK